MIAFKMLTEKEQAGIRAILNKLKPDDLYSLTFTVTKGFIKPETKDEAVQAIVLYCEKPSLLLRRKKVKKEIIFNYLHDVGVVASVSEEKTAYIKSCLQFWGSTETEQNECMDDSFDDTSSSRNVSMTPFFVQPTTFQEPTCVNPFGFFSDLDPKDIVRMGKEYVAWFYACLNKFSSGTETPELFVKQVFEQDCFLNWYVQDGQQVFNGSVNSGFETGQVLHEVFRAHQLLLQPGVDGAVSSYDTHGIVVVKVGGVVYRYNQSIGLFEQIFGLFQDPTQTLVWKVKRTDLKMKVDICFAKPLTM